MKKVLGFVVTLCTVATLFAAARPSLDGRAIVADAGTMPKGLFARTIGYLPGDSVSVTNPATGSAVDVLVLGSVDPTEGVAILLSPEAADKLNIKKDSNVQVKITKRAGTLDEAVSGTAVLAEGDDVVPAEAITPIADAASTGVVVEEFPLDYFTNTATDYTPDTSDVVETLPEYDATGSAGVVEELPEYTPYGEGDELAADDSPFDTLEEFPEYNPVAEEPDEPTDYSPFETLDDTPEYTASSPFDETPDTVSPYVDELPEVTAGIVEELPYDSLDYAGDTNTVDEIPGYSPLADTVAEEIPEVADTLIDTAATPLINEFDAAPIAEEPVVESPAVIAEESVSAPTASPETERIVFVEKPTVLDKDGNIVADDAVASSVPVDAEVTDYLTELADSLKSDTETVAAEEVVPANRLVAAESVPAESAAGEAEVESETPATESVIAETETESKAESAVVAETEPTADGSYQAIVLVPAGNNPPSADETPAYADVAKSVAPAATAPAPTAAPANDRDSRTVASLKDLQSGAYYVQIASLSQQENIDAVLAQYSEKYPIVLVPLNSGAAYQVLVGPLGVDEYKTIQTKFKAFGFKDAFLRKIR